MAIVRTPKVIDDAGAAAVLADLGELHRRIKPDLDPTVPAARAVWEARRRVPAPAG